ncbi:MAG: hypothetical protein V1768_01390 [Patescibacteria group bacterium]
MNKTIKITAVIIAVIILIAFVFFIWTYIKIKNGDLVKWDNKWYTKEELKKAFPPQYIEVPAKNTPEQVYTIFRQALLDNDIEKALEQIKNSEREKYKQVFSDPELLKKYQTIPEVGEIKESKNATYGNFTTYTYHDDTINQNEIPYTIKFMKNEYGYWQIEFI